MPVRIVAGILVGFAGGWAVSEAQRSNSEAEPAAQERGDPAADEPRCSSDPTVRAIQEQTGRC